MNNSNKGSFQFFFNKDIFLFLLFCLSLYTSSAQIVPIRKKDDNSITEKIKYDAEDSIYADVPNQKLFLFGNAQFNYEGVFLKAGQIALDYKTNEVFATFKVDENKKESQYPIFVDGTDTVRAKTLKYNFETKKAFIVSAAIHQEELFFNMGEAKRQVSEEIHFNTGRFTTCDLEEPHYHFQLSKGVLVPDKRIVTGPINLWIMGVPTPIGLPFSFIPQRKKKQNQSTIKGLLMGQFVPTSIYGIGLQDIGYYIPINDQFQSTFYGTIYSRGSFGLRNTSEYLKKYKYSGRFELGYNRFRLGFPSLNPAVSNIIFSWKHNQDRKAHPFWNFNSDVNFRSVGNNKQTLDPQPQNYFDNTLNSDITLSRNFGTKPLTLTIKTSLRQNSTTQQVGLISPDFSLIATRFFPFKSKKAVSGKQKFWEQIGFSYSLSGSNRSNFSSSVLTNLGSSTNPPNKFYQGLTHTITTQQTISLLKGLFRLTPAINYAQTLNFLQINKSIDTAQKLRIDTLQQAGWSQNASFSVDLTTSLYSYYRFIGKRKSLLRHVATPTVRFAYQPKIQRGIAEYIDLTGKTVLYSRFENSLYREQLINSSGRIDFSLNNTFELKQKDTKDTITGFRKLKIIESLQLNTSYDIAKDSLNWSNLGISMSTTLNKTTTITLRGIHSWYAWDEKTGLSNSKYALKNQQGLGRITQLNVSTNWNLTSKEHQDKLNANSSNNQAVWNPYFSNWLLSPYNYVDMEIPWKIGMSHVIGIDLNTDTSTYSRKKYNLTHTVNFTGDVSITENWKIGAGSYLDLVAMKVANTSINLTRNLHCWNMQMNWIPIGTNKSFIVSIRGNGQLLSNANLNLRRPPLLL